jgi:hypothetical protein
LIRVLAVSAADDEAGVVVEFGPEAVDEPVVAGVEAGVAVVMVAVVEAEVEGLTATGAGAGVWARVGYTIEAAAKAGPRNHSCRHRWKCRRLRLRQSPHRPHAANSTSRRPWEDPGRRACHRGGPRQPSSSSRPVCGDGNACGGGGWRHCSTRCSACLSGRLCSWPGRICRATCRWSSRPCASCGGHGWCGGAAHARCGSHRDSRSSWDT